MKLEINLTKGKFWVLVSLCIVVIGMFVLAEKPTPVGHSKGEIEGLDDLITAVEELKSKDSTINGSPEAGVCVWKHAENCPYGYSEHKLSTVNENILLVACCK